MVQILRIDALHCNNILLYRKVFGASDALTRGTNTGQIHERDVSTTNATRWLLVYFSGTDLTSITSIFSDRHS